MTISSIVVNRRAHVSTSGFTKDPKTESRVPELLELIRDIYDYQRDIISDIQPKRIKCKSPVPIKAIERIYHMNPGLMSFDGMTHYQALEVYLPQALNVGIRNDFCIPFIFAKTITVRSHAFHEGFSYIFEMIDGLRYMTLSTQQEFNWVTTKRQILSNLSYCINQKYNCNLHLAFDEAQRVADVTGILPEYHRDLFTHACNFYVEPTLLPIQEFIRCQVPELREYDDLSITALLSTDDDAIMEIDPKLAYALQQALSIYNGRITQWVGDFSDEPILNL